MTSDQKTTAAQELSKWVREWGEYASFIEMKNYLRNRMVVDGDRVWPLGPDRYLWSGLSQDFIDVLTEAIEEGWLFPHPGGFYAYLADGGVPGPITVKDPTTGEDKLVQWQPFTFCTIPHPEDLAA